jgi:hypothetical protein
VLTRQPSGAPLVAAAPAAHTSTQSRITVWPLSCSPSRASSGNSVMQSRPERDRTERRSRRSAARPPRSRPRGTRCGACTRATFMRQLVGRPPFADLFGFKGASGCGGSRRPSRSARRSRLVLGSSCACISCSRRDRRRRNIRVSSSGTHTASSSPADNNLASDPPSSRSVFARTCLIPCH